MFSDYDTRHIHCDAWSGAPKDSYNGFIYLFVLNNSPRLNLYRNLPQNHKCRNFLGKYLDAKIQNQFLKKLLLMQKREIWQCGKHIHHIILT